MAQEIGAIEIGIGVNVSKLKSELNEVTAAVRAQERSLRDNKFEIPVRLQAPSKTHIETIQRQIRTQLNYAQALGLKFTPELSISNETGTKFVNNLQTKLADKQVLVPVGADVDPVLFRSQIVKAVGVVNIPLTWHWAGKAPPGGAEGGAGGGPGPGGPGPGGGGGGGFRHGFRRGPAKPPGGGGATGSASTAGAWSSADTKWWKESATENDYQSAVANGLKPPVSLTQVQQRVARDLGKAQQAAQQATAKGQQAVRQTQQRQRDARGHFIKQQQTPPPVQAAPVSASVSGASPLAGMVPGAAQSPLAGLTAIPLPEAQRPGHTPNTNWMTRQSADPTIERLMERMKARDPNAIQDLLALGGSVKNGGISFRKNSVVGKAGDEQKTAIINAFQKFRTETGLTEDEDYAPPSKSGMGGAARRLAAPLGIDSETQMLNDVLQKIINAGQASRGRARYRESDPVKAFKAKVAELGGGDEGFLEATMGPRTDLIPNIGTNAHGIPTLLPSGYTQDQEGNPAQAQYPTLRDAMSFLEHGETDTARTIGRHQLARMFAENPQLSGQILSAARGRETNAKTGEESIPDPGLEGLASGIQAIFGTANILEAPRAEAEEKAARKQSMGARSTRLPSVEHAAREREIKAKVAAGGRTGSARGDLTEDLDKEGQRRLRAEEKRLTRRVARREHLQGLVGRIAKERAHPFGEISIIPAQRDKFGQLPPFSKRAEGGVMRSGGLMSRLVARGITPAGLPPGFDITKVGEHGEEHIVTDTNTGQAEVVPHHQGPAWLQRAAKHGLAKDMTGYGGGGSLWNRMKHAATGIAFRGPGGHYQAQGSIAGAAVAAGLASSLGGTIQRVFVVNWPNTGGSFAHGAAGQAAPASAAAGQAFSAQAQASVGAQQKAALQQASKTGKKRPDIPLTPLEEAQQAAKTQDLITAERLKQKELAASIQASIKEAPTRGTPTSVGEISAVSLGGLRNVIGRRRLADEATSRSTAALNLYSKAEERLGVLVQKSTKAQDPKKIAEYTKRIAEQHDAVDFLGKRYAALSDEATELSKNVISGADKLKIFGANTAGVITGTFLYSAALGAVQAGVGLLGEALGPAIERMTGFQNVSAKTVGTLSDQTRAAGGDTKATIAQAEATAGLSAASASLLAPTLDTRVATEAGNKALAEQIDLLHSAQAIQSQNKGQPVDRALVQDVSGAFGSSFGGTASTAELITNELNALPTAAQRAAPPAAGTTSRLVPGTNGNGPTFVQEPTQGAVDFAKNLAVGSDALKLFNAQAVKGGESVLQLAQVSQAQADASAKIAAQSPALQDIAKTLSTKGIALQGATKPEDFIRYLQSINIGAQTPDPQLLLQQAASRQIPNQVAAINAEEQQITLPTQSAQRALDFLSNRPLPFGAGIVPLGRGVEGEPAIGPTGPNSIGKFKGVDPAAAQSFNQYKDVATSALNAVIAKAKEGEQALTQLGVPPELVAEMTKLGKEAAGIQLGVADRQAKLEASEYSHELFILNRNLSDAEALAGQRVGREGELGRLQRENFEIGKRQQQLQFESQALSLGLSQKQINFQRALAGFQAPGETGQERAARIAEAKTEADYAQKQLNIQKQLFVLGKGGFKVSVRLFDVEAQRQVQDLKFALADLSAQHKLSLDMKSADQALAAIHAREGQVATGISNAIDKSNKFASARISQAVDIANQTGVAFATILTQTGVAWNKFIKQGTGAANSIINGLSGVSQQRPVGEHSAGTTQSGSPSSDVLHGGANAPGYFGTVSSATSMIVGEAGTETIAVLRNPRIHALGSPTGGGGTGGATIVIDVHDNNISGDKDEERIVARISRAVEQSMNRKGALLSLRTV